MHNSQLHVQVESYNYSWSVLPPEEGGGGSLSGDGQLIFYSYVKCNVKIPVVPKIIKLINHMSISPKN